MSLNGNHLNNFFSDKNIFTSKISDLVNTCDSLKDLMVAIYLIEKENFIYCNDTFKKSVGCDCNQLLKRGWDFWFSLVDKKEATQVQNNIFSFFSSPCFKTTVILKYHITNIAGEKIYMKHEISLHRWEKQFFAINYFFDISEKEKIEQYFELTESRDGFTIPKEQITKISPREKEVLQLVAEGYSSKQIANKLFISNHTAISHRKNLIEKFKVKNTAHLIKRASMNIGLW